MAHQNAHNEQCVIKVFSTEEEMIFFDRESVAITKMIHKHQNIVRAREIGVIQLT